MTQREVAPQLQSLCFSEQLRQSQNSHQIHLRWFTSSTKRATIQMRISVRDTSSNVSASRADRQWAERPNSPRPRSYEDELGRGRDSEKPAPPHRCGVFAATAWRRGRPRPRRG
jgi:hypothetical protein